MNKEELETEVQELKKRLSSAIQEKEDLQKQLQGQMNLELDVRRKLDATRDSLTYYAQECERLNSAREDVEGEDSHAK